MVAERDFDVMNQAEIRKAAKELGVRQNGVSVAELKEACKCAAVAVTPEAWDEGELNFEAMTKAELRKAAKELGVRQNGVSAAGLEDACKRAVWAGAVLGTACQALPATRKRKNSRNPCLLEQNV